MMSVYPSFSCLCICVGCVVGVLLGVCVFVFFSSFMRCFFWFLFFCLSTGACVYVCVSELVLVRECVCVFVCVNVGVFVFWVLVYLMFFIKGNSTKTSFVLFSLSPLTMSAGHRKCIHTRTAPNTQARCTLNIYTIPKKGGGG